MSAGRTCTWMPAHIERSDTDLTSQNFTIDSRQLTSAHLDAVYQLQAFDQYGNPSGSPPGPTSWPTGVEPGA